MTSMQSPAGHTRRDHRPLADLLRRLVRFASEDVDLADPNALVQAPAARDAYEYLGSPEGELAVSRHAH